MNITNNYKWYLTGNEYINLNECSIIFTNYEKYETTYNGKEDCYYVIKYSFNDEIKPLHSYIRDVSYYEDLFKDIIDNLSQDVYEFDVDHNLKKLPTKQLLFNWKLIKYKNNEFPKISKNMDTYLLINYNKILNIKFNYNPDTIKNENNYVRRVIYIDHLLIIGYFKNLHLEIGNTPKNAVTNEFNNLHTHIKHLNERVYELENIIKEMYKWSPLDEKQLNQTKKDFNEKNKLLENYKNEN